MWQVITVAHVAARVVLVSWTRARDGKKRVWVHALQVENAALAREVQRHLSAEVASGHKAREASKIGTGKSKARGPGGSSAVSPVTKTVTRKESKAAAADRERGRQAKPKSGLKKGSTKLDVLGFLGELGRSAGEAAEAPKVKGKNVMRMAML